MKNFLKRFPIIMRWYAQMQFLRNRPGLVEKVERRRFAQSPENAPLDAPIVQEAGLVENLRAQMRALPAESLSQTASGADRRWRAFKDALRVKILTEDPRDFFTWSVIGNNMGYSLPLKEYKQLSQFPFWKEWSRKLATMPLLKNERRYFKFPQADENILKQTYHLAQLKLRTDKDISSFDYVIDFGAGYGNMCATVHALGFKGTYILFDWPEFSALQEFNLKRRGIDTSHMHFVNTLAELEKAIPAGIGLLIATWSISETPETFRKEFFQIAKADYYLIAYQRAFGEVDNRIYFKEFIKEHPTTSWQDVPMRYLPSEGNRYLVGRPKAIATNPSVC